MSAAERKQRSRDKQRQQESDVPSWLRLRREIWQLVQQHYILANADELATALTAIGNAITAGNIFSMKFSEESGREFFEQLVNPDDGFAFQGLFPGLMKYQADPQVEREFPQVKERRLVHLISDITGQSQKDE